MNLKQIVPMVLIGIGSLYSELYPKQDNKKIQTQEMPSIENILPENFELDKNEFSQIAPLWSNRFQRNRGNGGDGRRRLVVRPIEFNPSNLFNNSSQDFHRANISSTNNPNWQRGWNWRRFRRRGRIRRADRDERRNITRLVEISNNEYTEPSTNLIREINGITNVYYTSFSNITARVVKGEEFFEALVPINADHIIIDNCLYSSIENIYTNSGEGSLYGKGIIKSAEGSVFKDLKEITIYRPAGGNLDIYNGKIEEIPDGEKYERK